MSYRNESVEQFVTEIASPELTPAGGTAAAMVAAIGTGVCEMVCVHAETHADSATSEDIARLQDGLATQRNHLYALADQDAEIVQNIFGSDAAALDKEAGNRLVGVPLAIGEECITVLEYGRETIEITDRDVVADAMTGMSLVHGALVACVHTVRWNLNGTIEISRADEIGGRIEQIESDGDALFRDAQSVFETI